MFRSVAIVALAFLASTTPAPAGGKKEKVEGYSEWRKGEFLVVDGQRLRPTLGMKFKGQAEARDFASLPLGYEVKAWGRRSADGTLFVERAEAKPNGSALFESEVQSMTDAAEAEFLRRGRITQTLQDGREEEVGRLRRSGPEVERVQAIVDRLRPPHVPRDRVRVYVVDNDEWNAFAMGNYSIYVYRGLLEDLDDDELAVVLGHELVHASHEHTRRQFKRAMFVQLAAIGALVAEESIDNETQRAVSQLLTQFTAAAFANGYGRALEDQADRVGLRYAFEAGYDVSRGPDLWNRFARKYGQGDKVTNFFFGDHSLASARARHLTDELRRYQIETPTFQAGADASGR